MHLKHIRKMALIGLGLVTPWYVGGGTQHQNPFMQLIEDGAWEGKEAYGIIWKSMKSYYDAITMQREMQQELKKCQTCTQQQELETTIHVQKRIAQNAGMQVFNTIQQYRVPVCFSLSVPGTRTVKQINLLNFAIRLFAEQEESALLRHLLGTRIILADLVEQGGHRSVLDFEDQYDQGLTPRDLVRQYYPNYCDKEESWFGQFMHRTSYNAAYDELSYEKNYNAST